MFFNLNKKQYYIFFLLFFLSLILNIFFLKKLYFYNKNILFNLKEKEISNMEIYDKKYDIPFTFEQISEISQQIEKKNFYEKKQNDNITEYYNFFLEKNLSQVINDDIIYEYKNFKKNFLFRIIDIKKNFLTEYNEDGLKKEQIFYKKNPENEKFDSKQINFIIKRIVYKKDGKNIQYIDEFSDQKENNLIRKTEYFSNNPEEYFVIKLDDQNNNIITTTYFFNNLIRYIIEYSDDMDMFKMKKIFYTETIPQKKKYVEENYCKIEDNFFVATKKTYFEYDSEKINIIEEFNLDKKIKITTIYLENNQFIKFYEKNII
ncbi:DUF2963 domain-containing protein [Candidatus Phytoplasma oryzae]|nr:hypothetical protein PIE28_00925 [Candidatus Phytoplasma oryzae]